MLATNTTPLTRRRALAGSGAALIGAFAGPGRARGATGQGSAPPATGASEWMSFLSRYVGAEGRVVDTGNGGISHSEGQGVGLLGAATFGDQESFRLLLHWTEQHLGRGDDALHSWCYRPNSPNPVPDQNNATDGDLLIGLALFTAADRWQEAEYRRKGLAIARDVRSGLLTRTASGTLLLPGIEGFTNAVDVTINPSYYLFPALQRFARELPDPVWASVYADGLALLAQARFGNWQLPPDWLSVSRVGGNLRPASHWPARCSFDAVRVPLYLCWASQAGHPAVSAFAKYWKQKGGSTAPAWSDLVNAGQAPYALTQGMDAIRRFTEAATEPGSKPNLPLIARASDYYSAALTLLVHVAIAANPTYQPQSS